MACNFEKPCSSGNFNFIFVGEGQTFDSAQRRCEQKGGTLANILGRTHYENLNKCCSQGDFWIGLVDQNRCRNTPDKPYQWVKTSACQSALPLTLKHQSHNHCQAVVITFNTQSLPGSRLHPCNNPLPYICKIRKQAITTTKAPTTTRKKRKTSQALTSTTPQRPLRTTLWSSTEKNFLEPTIISRATKFKDQDNYLSKASTVNPGVIVGAVLGFLIIILLVLLVSWRCKKRDNRKLHRLFSQRKKNNSSRINGNSVNQVNQNILYNSITPSSLAHEPDNFPREDFNDGTYSTLNGEEAAYQTINERTKEAKPEETTDCVYAAVKKSKNNNKKTGCSPTTNKSHKIQLKDEQNDRSNACTYIESNADVIEAQKNIEVEEQPSGLYATVNKAKKRN